MAEPVHKTDATIAAEDAMMEELKKQILEKYPDAVVINNEDKDDTWSDW